LPGFIAYLHPIDDTHLAGIGREPGAGGMMQLKVALLDVTDLSDPKLQAVQLVGQGWSYSDALWDPKAFTWLPAQKMLAIPFADYGGPGLRLRPAAVPGRSGGRHHPGAREPLDVRRLPDLVRPGWTYKLVAVGSAAASSPTPADGQFVYAISDAGVALGPGGKLAGAAPDGEVPTARLSVKRTGATPRPRSRGDDGLRCPGPIPDTGASPW
jgi:hypothetical protein